MHASFTELARHAKNPPHSEDLEWQGHRIHVPLAAGGVASFGFHDLFTKVCPLAVALPADSAAQDYGAGDFFTIARKYHTILISDIPPLQLHHKNAARRFITFLDAVYENKVGERGVCFSLTTARA
jgi:predicted ATPase